MADQQTNPLIAAVMGPDVLARQYALERQQQYAQMLMKQAIDNGNGPAGDMVSGHYVPTFNGLKSLSQALMYRNAAEDLPKQQSELANAQMQGMSRAFGLGGDAMPSGANSAAMAAGAMGGDVGPTISNALRMDAMSTGQPSASPMYPSLPGRDARSSMAMALSMGMPEYMKMVATQTAPSAEATRGRELGIDQQTQLTNYLAAQHKAGYIAPTRLGEGAYADASGNVQGLPAAALPGYINQKDQNGNWVTSAVNGGLDAVKASKAAQAIGNATTEIMPQTYGPRGEALPYQTKREAIEGVNAPPVTSGAGDPTRAQSGGASGLDIQAALREIANTKASMSSVTDQSSKQALQAHIDDITKQISNVGNYPASMSGIPSAPSAGAGRGSLVPQLGVQNNINLLQGQGSDLLKSAQAEQAGNLQTNQYFDEIAHLMGNGAKFGPMQADIAKWKAMVPGVDLTGAQTNQDVMRKLSANLAGNRGTRSDADLANWQKAYPNGEMTNDAISQVLPMLRQTLGVGNARAKVLTSQSTNGGLETLPKVANEFNQIASPSVIADGNALAQASASGKLNDFMARIKQKYPNDWSQRLQTIKKLDGMGAF